MKNIYIPFVLISLIILCGCKKDDIETKPRSEDVIDRDTQSEETNLTGSNAIFFGQTHLYPAEKFEAEFVDNEPDPQDYKLISNRDMMVKINTLETTDSNSIYTNSSNVRVLVSLNGEEESISMTPPTDSFEPISRDIGKVKHSFKDSFTAVIDKKWIQPGLEMSITSNCNNDCGNVKTFDAIKIGAPNKLRVNMFDIKFFKESSIDYPDGFIEEMESKFPVSEIEIERIGVVFPEVTIIPDANTPAYRVSSVQEYLDITGNTHVARDQDITSHINAALKRAAGIKARYSLFWSNAHGLSTASLSTGKGSPSNLTTNVMMNNQKRTYGNRIGIAAHELGHALSLVHWEEYNCETCNYPYIGEMHGIKPPTIKGGFHAGPVWGLDLKKMKFLPPTVQEDHEKWDGRIFSGGYKKDPMKGGSMGGQEPGFFITKFSDFSVRKMQNYLERELQVLTSNIGQEATYARWDDNTKDYTIPIERHHSDYAIKQNVDVISVVVTVCHTKPDATIAYPPIGPYVSGLIEEYDPTTQEGRDLGKRWHCAPNCDISVRVVQGGKTKTRMLDMRLRDDDDKIIEFGTNGVNFPAADGDITKIEILKTPKAQDNGVPTNVEILDTWTR